MTQVFNISQSVYHLPKLSHDEMEIAAFDEGYLSVSHKHSLWFSQYGNPQGVPAIVVHGGPGAGCNPRQVQFLDPDFYRIILLDQRGAGRSHPLAEIQDNTTNELIADMEKLRVHLNIESWLLFGGSWGSALSLAYGQSHPDRCLGFVLRGVFLGTKKEYLQLWNGMGDIYPEAFHDYQEFLPSHERDNLLENYYRRLMSDDKNIHMPAARAFYQYDSLCATLIDKSQVATNLSNDGMVLAVSRLFAHYSMHEFFFTDDQLIRNLEKISHLKALIVHGRYDVICRVSSAFRLHKAWPNSHLTIVADAGHSPYEPGLAKALRDATEKFKKELALVL